MSDVLTYLTANTAIFPLKQVLYSTMPSSLPSKIEGHIIKEVKVVKPVKKVLSLPIKVPSKKSPQPAKSARCTKSPHISPLHSPKSMSALKATSPQLKSSKNGTIKPKSKASERKDIDNILKHALKVEKNQKKTEKIKEEEETKQKLQKKLQMKAFDEYIRQENFQKFKQKLPLTRPKWDTGKVEKKALIKKKRKNSLSFVFLSGNKGKKEDKERRKKSSKGKKTENIGKALRRLIAISERLVKLRTWKIFKKNTEGNKEESISSKSEDKEVQKIMKGEKHKAKANTKQHKTHKSYEKLLENQVKLKMYQQEQLVSLKTKDIQEMNKLADVFGNNPEIKVKFQEMLDRRYSKLENLFEENLENIKNVLGLQGYSVDLDFEEMVGKPRKSLPENSSNILKNIYEESLKSTPDRSVIEKAGFSEEEIIEKPIFNAKSSALFLLLNEEEPAFPVLPESSQSKSLKFSDEFSLKDLVNHIKSEIGSDIRSDNSIELVPEAPREKNPILILDDSCSSSTEKEMIFSSIHGNQEIITSLPFLEESIEKKEPKNFDIFRLSNFEFNTSLQSSLEKSTETEGFTLIIERILLTLELNVFSMILQEILDDDIFISAIQIRSSDDMRTTVIDFDKHIEVNEEAILKTVRQLENLKPKNEVLEKIKKIYDPVFLLSQVQENLEDPNEEIYLFEYGDLNFIESEEEDSLFQNLSRSVNPYKMIYGKMIVDVLNEALITSAKNKVAKPWKIRNQIDFLDYDKVIKSGNKKIFKWCRIEAGKIPSVEMINSQGFIDEEKLQVARRDKLAELLVFENEEVDSLWIECDVEEAQTAIDLAEWITNGLVWEALDLLNIL